MESRRLDIGRIIGEPSLIDRDPRWLGRRLFGRRGDPRHGYAGLRLDDGLLRHLTDRSSLRRSAAARRLAHRCARQPRRCGRMRPPSCRRCASSLATHSAPAALQDRCAQLQRLAAALEPSVIGTELSLILTRPRSRRRVCAQRSARCPRRAHLVPRRGHGDGRCQDVRRGRVLRAVLIRGGVNDMPIGGLSDLRPLLADASGNNSNGDLEPVLSRSHGPVDVPNVGPVGAGAILARYDLGGGDHQDHVALLSRRRP